MAIKNNHSVFKELEDYDGVQILIQLYDRIRRDIKHCRIVLPKHIASFNCADVYLLIDEKDFMYFEDLLDEKEYSHNKYIRFIAKTDKYGDFEELTKEGDHIYDF